MILEFLVGRASGSLALDVFVFKVLPDLSHSQKAIRLLTWGFGEQNPVFSLELLPWLRSALGTSGKMANCVPHGAAFPACGLRQPCSQTGHSPLAPCRLMLTREWQQPQGSAPCSPLIPPAGEQVSERASIRSSGLQRWKMLPP